MIEPLRRVELAVTSLSEDLGDVSSLPAIHGELVRVNETMTAVLEALQGLRHDLGESATADGRETGKKRRGAGAAR
ncbi:MAG: hypothetical protein H0V08_07205 [Thermoleophilaceae bacterium]|nr:hypothetical protein [Thermoleophilaceae bacterium]